MNTSIVLASLVLAQLLGGLAHAQFLPYPQQQMQPLLQQQVQTAVPQINPASPVGTLSNLGGVQLQYYGQWCNQATLILNQAATLAQGLYSRQLFTQAKQTIQEGFNRAIRASTGPIGGAQGFPGSFRPYTYQELARSIQLINRLETSPAPNQTLKDKMITFVSIQRVQFVNKMNVLDQNYVIPCALGCQTQSHSSVNLVAFEGQLIALAQSQLRAVQDYATLTVGQMTYPLMDANTYFTIIGSAAQWAAFDLSYAHFSTAFSCAITHLMQLEGYARQVQASFGDPAAVQIVSHAVEQVIQSLSLPRYGCGVSIQYPF